MGTDNYVSNVTHKFIFRPGSVYVNQVTMVMSVRLSVLMDCGVRDVTVRVHVMRRPSVTGQQGHVSLTARLAGWARTVISVSAGQAGPGREGRMSRGDWATGTCLTDCKAGWMGEDCDQRECRADRRAKQAGRDG